jgi:hypothetical protein
MKVYFNKIQTLLEVQVQVHNVLSGYRPASDHKAQKQAISLHQTHNLTALDDLCNSSRLGSQLASHVVKTKL